MAEKEASQSEAAETNRLPCARNGNRPRDRLPSRTRSEEGTGDDGGTQSSGENPRLSRIQARPRRQGICRSPGDGVNFDALQVEIAKEIDSLFVPEGMPAQDEGPVQIGRHEQPKRAQGRRRNPRQPGKPATFPNPGTATVSRNLQEARRRRQFRRPPGRDR